MNWSDITVQQFQQLEEIRLRSEGLEPLLVGLDMIGVCYNLTPAQVDSLSTSDVNRLAREMVSLNDVPDWKPVKTFMVDRRRYRFVYDVRQIHAARNIEVKVFESQGGFIANMHKMAASMVVPQKKNFWRNWIDDTYNAANHEQYADDILQASISAIYGSALFFCGVLMNAMPLLEDYMTSKIPEAMRSQASQTLAASFEIMAGNFPQLKLQSMSASA